MMNGQIRSKHVEQTKKNCGIKIDYKNCASRWLLTHFNMTHGTHNIKLKFFDSNLKSQVSQEEKNL